MLLFFIFKGNVKYDDGKTLRNEMQRCIKSDDRERLEELIMIGLDPYGKYKDRKIEAAMNKKVGPFFKDRKENVSKFFQ